MIQPQKKHTPPGCGPTSKAIVAADWSWVAGWLTGRLGVCVTADWVLANMPINSDGQLVSGYYYSDGSWETWFKNKMRDQGLFVVKFSGMTFDRLTCELHVGFLSLEENAEHLENLRREDNSRLRKGPQTPGIERREAPLGPIDRTAARVMTTEDKK